MSDADKNGTKGDEVMKERCDEDEKILSKEDVLKELSNKMSSGKPKIIENIPIQYDPKLFKKNNNILRTNNEKIENFRKCDISVQRRF